uniref:SFRICE_006610 n=1 Tax=Spodoptera frugiperda TaxID=7108 RepID=A0A2H1VBS9_SPOFR
MSEKHAEQADISPDGKQSPSSMDTRNTSGVTTTMSNMTPMAKFFTEMTARAIKRVEITPRVNMTEILALRAITLHYRDENDDVRQRQKAEQLQLADDLQTPAGV